MFRTDESFVDNGAGWRLALYRTWDDQTLVQRRRPVVIVPGYGMNSYIFDFHPSDRSFVRSLAARGFEVWRVDLRAQGGSTSKARGDQFRLADLALTDLGAALQAVRERSHAQADRVDVIGASLGGSLLLTHAVLRPEAKLGALVVMGTPIRWVDVHPVVRLAFASPMLVGMLRLRGTRRFSEIVLPQLARFLPWVLRVYMNPEITDTSAARELVRTVEDPNRFINQELARWINAGDLVVDGVNIAAALPTLRHPFMCVLANEDGIVPRRTAEFAYHQIGSEERQLLVVGHDDLAVAHADMFISRHTEAHVFEPIAQWLQAQNEAE